MEHRFSPYRDIRERLEFAASRGAELPRELPLYRRKLAGIEEERRQSAQIAFCHNDPFPNNFIDDGTVRLIDWEGGLRLSRSGEEYFQQNGRRGHLPGEGGPIKPARSRYSPILPGLTGAVPFPL